MVVITGALSYAGKYATRVLLDRGYRVRTLTFHPNRENPFGERVQVLSYEFDKPDRLRANLDGASTLINTYWVRFPYGGCTFDTAVQNTRVLIEAAREAGVKRIVHVSIANPSLDSPLGYYRGKAQVEEMVRNSGLSYAILRPTVIFGYEDVLINNISWFVRRFPIFGVPGDGRYRVQPIYVEDMAGLIVGAVERGDNYVLEAVGPEIFTFEQLVKLISAAIGRPGRIVHVPALMAYITTRVIGWFLRDVVLTWDEYKGLMSNLLVSENPPPGKTRLTRWLLENRRHLGVQYASELARHFQRSGYP
jgi:NADH dehydrogenase